jgi:hypothetical protein
MLSGKQGVMYVSIRAARKSGDGKDEPNLLLHVS